MAAPEYVPVQLADLPRQAERIPPADPWRADRPADLHHGQPVGDRFGRPGPDQGFALKLARRFVDRLQLQPGEDVDDAVVGSVAVALKRASFFGRAPVIHDVDLAYTLFGFLGGAPDDLLAWRQPRFQSVRHHYDDQRDLVDRVPVETLRLTPAQVRDQLTGWRELVRV